MTETDAQYTARLMEKYKEVLDQIDKQGLTKDQQFIDDLIVKAYKLAKLDLLKEEKILKELNIRINEYLKSQ